MHVKAWGGLLTVATTVGLIGLIATIPAQSVEGVGPAPIDEVAADLGDTVDDTLGGEGDDPDKQSAEETCVKEGTCEEKEDEPAPDPPQEDPADPDGTDDPTEAGGVEATDPTTSSEGGSADAGAPSDSRAPSGADEEATSQEGAGATAAIGAGGDDGASDRAPGKKGPAIAAGIGLVAVFAAGAVVVAWRRRHT